MKIEIPEIIPEITYPKHKETIFSPIYTICISAPTGVRALDISIGQGPWRACQKAVGYWWYEWADYANGEYTIIARTRAQNGRWLMSSPRELQVDLLKRRGLSRQSLRAVGLFESRMSGSVK